MKCLSVFFTESVFISVNCGCNDRGLGLTVAVEQQPIACLEGIRKAFGVAVHISHDGYTFPGMETGALHIANKMATFQQSNTHRAYVHCAHETLDVRKEAGDSFLHACSVDVDD